MKNTATKINWKGMECIQLCAGGYTALIAPGIGSNVLRLHDDAHGVEFFRWDENNTPEDIKQSAEVWGLPTLYLPNRFADGVLKTSDATYQLPVNEAAPFHNHIHGFLHKREHRSGILCQRRGRMAADCLYVQRKRPVFSVYAPAVHRRVFLCAE
ncbi:MAG: hypothetical protein ACLUOF_12780 [Ruminococcus sp.]